MAAKKRAVRPAKKAARPVASKPKARTVRKAKPATRPTNPGKAASAWQFETGGRKVKAFVPTECPLCGSKQLVVRKPDSPAKVVGKVAAGLVVPLLIEFQARASCKVCGWRSEGTY